MALMVLPELQKSWQFNVNHLVMPNANAGYQISSEDKDRDAMIWLKNGLKSWASAPWTVAGSSNGIDEAAMDGLDRWGGYDNVVWANPGAHSWIVLTTPAGPAQLCIDLASGVSRVCTFGFSPEGLYTGGSVTARPTAVDEVCAVNKEWLDGTWVTPHKARLHLLQTTDGKVCLFLVCRNGVCIGGWLVFQVTNIEPGWETDADGFDSPYSFVRMYAGTDSVFKYKALTDNALLYYWKTGSKKAYVGGAGTTFEFQFCAEGIKLPPVNNSRPIGYEWGGRNAISGGWPMSAMTMVTQEAGVEGVKGIVPDIYLAATTRPTGTNYEADPHNPTREWVQFGDIIVPWNGSIPLVTQ
jgi:hypothetical protein